LSTYTDEGIVLRRIDYGEADRILTVLTREHGKIGVIARGVRKAPGRMAPHTDLFARSSMQIARGRGQLEVLTQAQRVGPALPSSDARRIACASLCAELADRVLEGDHPLEPAIYELVADALAACADAARDPRAAVAWFARRMIDRLGYAPELTVCASCATPLEERPAVFSAAGGGLLCPRCGPSDPGAVDCSVRVIKVLRVIAAGDADLYPRLRLDAETLEVLELVVERELAQHVDRRLRSLEVLRAVF
jgi:DNA repair protein RecO (recombination protein O)